MAIHKIKLQMILIKNLWETSWTSFSSTALNNAFGLLGKWSPHGVVILLFCESAFPKAVRGLSGPFYNNGGKMGADNVFCCTEPPRKDPKSAFVVVTAVNLLHLVATSVKIWPWRVDSYPIRKRAKQLVLLLSKQLAQFLSCLTCDLQHPIILKLR